MADHYLVDGDFIDLTGEVSSNNRKKTVVKVVPSQKAGNNVNVTASVPSKTNVGLLVEEKTKSQSKLKLGTCNIIITPSSSEIRQKKFPIEKSNNEICTDTTKELKNQMAILIPIIPRSDKQPKPVVVDITGTKHVRNNKQCVKTGTQEIGARKKAENKVQHIQKQSQIIIQDVFTVSEGSSESQTVQKDTDVICLSDEETSTRQSSKSLVEQANTDAIKEGRNFMKQIPPDAQKLKNSQNIVPLAVTKTVEDIIETSSAVKAINLDKEVGEQPVPFLCYPLDSENVPRGQVKTFLAFVPNNLELTPNSFLAFQNSDVNNSTQAETSHSKKVLLATKIANDGNQAKLVNLESICCTDKVEEQKTTSTPSMAEFNRRYIKNPHSQVKNNIARKMDQIIDVTDGDLLVSSSIQSKDPQEVSQIGSKKCILKNVIKPSTPTTLSKDLIKIKDNFIVPTIPAPRKKPCSITQTVKLVTSPRIRKDNIAPVRDPLGDGDDDVQIEPMGAFTPVDIAQIINKGKTPEIKGRCEYFQMLEPEEDKFKGYMRREINKSSCCKELDKIINEEEIKVAESKKSIKSKYESNFVSCGGRTDYFLPETHVKSEIIDICEDLTEENLPTISEVISRVNKEVIELKKLREKSTIVAGVSKRNEALQMIKKGLEMMQEWSHKSIEPDAVLEIDEIKDSGGNKKIVAMKRQRKLKTTQDVEIEPPKKSQEEVPKKIQIRTVKCTQKKRKVDAIKPNRKQDLTYMAQSNPLETKNLAVKRKRVKKVNVNSNSDDLLVIKRVAIIRDSKLTTEVRRRN